MGFFNWLSNWWSGTGRLDTTSAPQSTSNSGTTCEPPVINPATGLPMMGGIGGLDVEGNPYGVDLHSHRDAFDLGATSETAMTSVCETAGEIPAINPATCLPMVGSLDIEGNPYGVDSRSHHDVGSSTDMSDDSWTQSSSTDWGYSSFTDSGIGGSSWDD